MELYANTDSWNGFTAQADITNNEVYKAVLFAQFMHETGNASSELYKSYNNLYGMRPSQKRDQFWHDTVSYTSQAGKSTYASYDSKLYSLLDRIDWDCYNNISPPEKDSGILPYFRAVYNHNYFTDDPEKYFLAWSNHGKKNYPDLAWPSSDDIRSDLENEPVAGSGKSTVVGGVIGTVALLALGLYLFKKLKKRR